MAASADLSTKFALDVQAVNELRIVRGAGNKTDQAALEAAAKQFEALFMNMMLKSMRDATPKDSLVDSEQSRLYISMLDQQLSQSMSSNGIGLADIMIRQLRHGVPGLEEEAQAPDTAFPGQSPLLKTPSVAPLQVDAYRQQRAPVLGSGASEPEASRSEIPALQQLPASPGPSAPAGTAPLQPGAQTQPQQSQVIEFQARLMPYAQQASQTTGIPARFMLGQAALESGWGKREIRGADGTPSHNLFGVKAGGNWKGPVVETVTTEYIDGIAHKSVEKFRAYPSYADAFRDYANLLSSNPRYAELMARVAKGLDAEGFAQGLQQAGYATDPDYASKLNRIIRTTPWS
ncbi:flagellar assembly peptidoglycan hydrolase FlgJ [Nitrosospira briensis]|uniref:flagellar assembly peptidoglycan hydrolase FlgJ n=1 Tax=Nitrosospira briensis TaxID=35799 RepID=UPI0008F3AF8A|nr:flagellar assembly peptidoglycan hydrolase FlgJ [Nitrosospira briensis]SFN70678.1 flagellar protein FlgJ [Nitrosospira briensis]